MLDLTQLLEALANEDRHRGRSCAMYSAALEIRALRIMLGDVWRSVPGNEEMTDLQIESGISAYIESMHKLHLWAPGRYDA